ncbi:hypothetical protein Tco_1244322 [Tanacetum coccineum]
MDHLWQGSIPFSWENRPGVCKDGQQNLAMESRSVVVHDNSHTKDEMRVSLHRNSSTKEGNTNKTIISHDIGLPLPPCAFHQPSLKSSSRRIKDDDPFLMAYKECTKSNKKGTLTRKNSLLGSCKLSCSVRDDSIVRVSNVPMSNSDRKRFDRGV